MLSDKSEHRYTQSQSQSQTHSHRNTHTNNQFRYILTIEIIIIHRRCGIYRFYLCLFDKNEQYLTGYWMSNSFCGFFPFVRCFIHSEYFDFISLLDWNTLRLPSSSSSLDDFTQTKYRFFFYQILLDLVEFVFLYFFNYFIFFTHPYNLFIEIKKKNRYVPVYRLKLNQINHNNNLKRNINKL